MIATAVDPMTAGELAAEMEAALNLGPNYVKGAPWTNKTSDLLQTLLDIRTIRLLKLKGPRNYDTDTPEPSIADTIDLVEHANLPEWATEQDRSILLHDLSHQLAELEIEFAE